MLDEAAGGVRQRPRLRVREDEGAERPGFVDQHDRKPGSPGKPGECGARDDRDARAREHHFEEQREGGHLDDRRVGEAERAGALTHRVPHRRRLDEADIGVSEYGREVGAVRRRQRMTRGRHEDVAVDRERNDLDLVRMIPGRRLDAEGELGLTGQNLQNRLGALSFEKREPHGFVGQEAPHRGRKVVLNAGTVGRDAQRRALALAEGTQGGLHLCDRGEDPLGVRPHRETGGREREPARFAHEERRSEGALELFEPKAHGRGGAVHFFGGRRHVERAGEREEDLEVGEIVTHGAEKRRKGGRAVGREARL